MRFDPFDYTYASRRNVTYGLNGMVASSQPQASQAGIEILKKGGNAIDAAVAMAVALTVVEPTSNGIGGDAFAMVWNKAGLSGLNASGYAGELSDALRLKKMGHDVMPPYGFQPVTVPGIPSAWIALSKKYGKLPFEELFKPAIRYAEEGFVVTATISELWKKEFEIHQKEHQEQPEFKEWFQTFAPKGRAPYAGEVWKNPVQAQTLKELADTECESFYRGKIAEKIAAFSEKYHGNITKHDLEIYDPEWVEPLCVNYRGYDVWEMPPNGHGLVVLMALNILNGYEWEKRECMDTYHKSIEALKLAYADGKKYITDSRYMKVSPEQLLKKDYALQRRKMIGKQAVMPEAGDPQFGGTVYLCAADREGNMVSYIQSNYWEFGSGMVVPGTSIALHNRGKEFSLNKEDYNYLQPGKRPYHTIIPGFLSKNGEPLGPFGVMGAYMQPQGHIQVVQNLIDFHMNPQQALNVPRWQWVGGKKVLVEKGFPEKIRKELEKMGHEIAISKDTLSFGRGQIILKQENGTLIGGTEPRADGAVLGF